MKSLHCISIILTSYTFNTKIYNLSLQSPLPSVCSEDIRGGGFQGTEYLSRYQEYGVQPRVATFKPNVEPYNVDVAMESTTTNK